MVAGIGVPLMLVTNTLLLLFPGALARKPPFPPVKFTVASGLTTRFPMVRAADDPTGACGTEMVLCPWVADTVLSVWAESIDPPGVRVRVPPRRVTGVAAGMRTGFGLPTGLRPDWSMFSPP